MVVDGGGHFSPAGIDGVHTLTLLLSSQAAHGRETGDTRVHKKAQRTQLHRYRAWVQYKPRQGGINSVPM